VEKGPAAIGLTLLDLPPPHTHTHTKASTVTLNISQRPSALLSHLKTRILLLSLSGLSLCHGGFPASRVLSKNNTLGLKRVTWRGEFGSQVVIIRLK